MPVLAIAYAVAAVVAVPRGSSPQPTTYAAVSTAADAVDLAAGLALLSVGVIAWVGLQSRRIGGLALLAGLAWFGADWDGWAGGPSIVRSLGSVAMPFFVVLVFHLAMAFPSGRLRSPFERVLVSAAYILAVAVGLARALFRDPLLDLNCWRNCYDNAFFVHGDPGLARDLDSVLAASTLAIGLALAAAAIWRLGRANTSSRRALWPTLAPAGLVGGVEAAYAAALLHTPFEDPKTTEYHSLFLAQALAVTVFAAGVGIGVLHLLRTRLAVSRLADELRKAPPPGTLRERLASALGDPQLQIAYWLPALGRHVDGRGRTIEPPTSSSDGRAVTPIVRAGQPIALVLHDPALADGAQLVREIGAAARLAVENERLHAEVLAQLEDLRASQVRIVETADRERRRLERDLHDGAQQQLLALSYELRLARAAAERDRYPQLAAQLTSALGDAGSALDELRTLAHGIFPSVLTGSGLGPALETLADAAPIPVDLAGVGVERYPPQVETTAYMTVAEAIEAVVSGGASYAAVNAHRVRGRLRVTVEADSNGGAGRLPLDDRVGALGGSVKRRAGVLQAEIPCE